MNERECLNCDAELVGLSYCTDEAECEGRMENPLDIEDES